MQVVNKEGSVATGGVLKLTVTTEGGENHVRMTGTGFEFDMVPIPLDFPPAILFMASIDTVIAAPTGTPKSSTPKRTS